ncbi:hypothetical protein HD806DRAFT_499255 [Xylariaceae sp. AK1471]|nr:hypothetical protein HD806DRAFT_499255 [Xylariaceae sp. AK1471]
MVLDNLSPVRLAAANIPRKKLMGVAGGVFSCIEDLVSIYQAILKVCTHQFDTGSPAHPGVRSIILPRQCRLLHFSPEPLSMSLLMATHGYAPSSLTRCAKSVPTTAFWETLW